MVNRLVSFALSQRFIVIIAALCLGIWGIISFQNLPIDAYPDLSPPQVQIVSQWPGHAAEEVERLITIPLEVEMNGIPKLDALRSISLYGLSSITMNFLYDTDPYFAREQAFERIADASVPSGVTPGMSPLFSPSGLIYRYVLQSPDRSGRDLKILEDWVLERRYRAIQGVADDSSLGGETMQYQVQVDPNRLMSFGVTVPQVVQQLSNNNSNAGGGFYSQGGQFYYVRGLGLVRSLEDIGHVLISAKAGIPVTVNDIGNVAIGAAPRLGQFGYMNDNDAVEGVILMRVGEQAQVILKKVQELTATLNRTVLPPDVKIVPYYDRTDLIAETTQTVERNLLRGMLLVLVILGIFLFSVRTALIVAVTIPFALMFSFICLDWRHIPANLLSIGAIDFGIIVDGAVVMVENIFRELAERHGQKYDLISVIRSAAKDVERPIFYAIAVIIAGYLPIYVLTGPSGRLFRPMADTMGFALLGSLICTLTAAPGALLVFPQQERQGAHRQGLRPRARRLWPRARVVPAPSQRDGRGLSVRLRRVAAPGAVHRRRIHAAPGRGRDLDARDDAVHDLVRRGVKARASGARAAAQLSTGDDGRQRTGPARRRHRPDRLFQRRVFRRVEAIRRPGLGRFGAQQAGADRRHSTEGQGVSRHHLQLHAAGRGRGGRSRDRPQELAGGQNLRRGSRHPRVEGRGGPEGDFDGAGHHQCHPGARARPAESDDRTRSREDRTVRPERRRHQRVDRDRRRRRAGDAGHTGRALVRSRRPPAGTVSAEHGGDQEHPGRHCRRPAPAAESIRGHQGQQRSLVHLPRVEFAVCRHPVQCRRPRSGERGGRRAPESGHDGAAAQRLYLRLGRRIQGVPRRRGRRWRSSCR